MQPPTDRTPDGPQWEDETEFHLPEHHSPLPELSHTDPHGQIGTAAFQEMKASPEYRELRSKFTTFAFPIVITSMIWYLFFVLMSTYGTSIMAKPVFGRLNVGLVIGLLQFVTTWIITWAYVRHANNNLDPRSQAIKARLEKGTSA